MIEFADIHWRDYIEANDEIVSITRSIGPSFDISHAPQTEYHIIYRSGREIYVREQDLTSEQRNRIDQFVAKTNRFMQLDPSWFIKKKPKRLRCEYCGRISTTDRPTCEGCGAVLPWEVDYEA